MCPLTATVDSCWTMVGRVVSLGACWADRRLRSIVRRPFSTPHYPCQCKTLRVPSSRLLRTLPFRNPHGQL